MTQAEAQKRAYQAWDDIRAKLNLKGHKYGVPRQLYLRQFSREDFQSPDIYTAMENFLTDPWWSSPDHVKYQDLEHFIKNYEKFMPENYERSEPEDKPLIFERY